MLSMLQHSWLCLIVDWWEIGYVLKKHALNMSSIQFFSCKFKYLRFLSSPWFWSSLDKSVNYGGYLGQFVNLSWRKNLRFAKTSDSLTISFVRRLRSVSSVTSTRSNLFVICSEQQFMALISLVFFFSLCRMGRRCTWNASGRSCSLTGNAKCFT